MRKKWKAGRKPIMGEAMGLYAFRLPDRLVEEIEAHAKRLQAARPGSLVSRADALRALVIEALGRHRR